MLYYICIYIYIACVCSKLDDDILGLLAVDTKFKGLPPPQSQESYHNVVNQAAAVGSLKKEESVSLKFCSVVSLCLSSEDHH